MRVSKIRICMKRIFARVFTFILCIALFSLFIRFTSEKHNFNYEYKLRKRNVGPPFLSSPKEWIDSVFNSLTPSQKIAQLLMVAAYSNKTDYHKKEISRLVQKYNIGGLIFFRPEFLNLLDVLLTIELNKFIFFKFSHVFICCKLISPNLNNC